MTDKTIINGIDVSQCEFSSLMGIFVICFCDDTRERYASYSDSCYENPNCYFKQLARARGEIEKFKDKVKYMKEYIKTVETARNEIEQECEELKQWKKDAENLFETQTDNADKIINQYKQAITDIKYACEDECIEGITGYVVDTKELEK